MKKNFLIRNTSDSVENLEQANRLVECFGNEIAYDLAISILQILNRKDYCVWQTFSKEDIEEYDRKKPTHERMEELHSRLGNVWELIY